MALLYALNVPCLTATTVDELRVESDKHRRRW